MAEFCLPIRALSACVYDTARHAPTRRLCYPGVTRRAPVRRTGLPGRVTAPQARGAVPVKMTGGHMAKALTARTVEVAKAAGARREVPDGLLAGFYLVIQPSGNKSW